MPILPLTGSFRLPGDDRIGHLNTSEVYVVTTHGFSSSGNPGWLYRLTAPTVKEVERQFDQQKDLAFFPGIYWGHSGGNRILMVSRAPCSPELPDSPEMNRYWDGGTPRAVWDISACTNLREILPSISALIRSKGCISPEIFPFD